MSTNKLCKITFYADLDEKDIDAMMNCFYTAMKDSMEIDSCYGLSIEEQRDSDNEDTDEIIPDLILEDSELVSRDLRTGNITVDKQIFDDFQEGTYVNISFADLDDDTPHRYEMISETEDTIEMQYLD